MNMSQICHSLRRSRAMQTPCRHHNVSPPLSMSCAASINSTRTPSLLMSSLIVSFHLFLGLEGYRFDQRLFFSAATCPAHLSLWARTISEINGTPVISRNFRICLLLHAPSSPSYTGPQIFLSRPFFENIQSLLHMFIHPPIWPLLRANGLWNISSWLRHIVFQPIFSQGLQPPSHFSSL